MSYEVIEIKPRDHTLPMSGKNCTISVDGKELRGVTAVDFRVSVGHLATVKLEMIGNIRIHGEMKMLPQEESIAGHSEMDPATGKEPF